MGQAGDGDDSHRHGDRNDDPVMLGLVETFDSPGASFLDVRRVDELDAAFTVAAAASWTAVSRNAVVWMVLHLRCSARAGSREGWRHEPG